MAPRRRFPAPLAAALVLALAALLAAGLFDDAAARGPLFGVVRPEGGFSPADWGPLAPLMTRIAVWQGELYRLLSGLVARFRTDPAAGLSLVGISFLYGVLHAAGPGHGKAVISSYLVANGAAARRGIALSFAAAAVQAVSAIALVAVLAILLRATSLQMSAAAVRIELASYGLIALIGALLVIRKLAGLVRRRGGAAAHDHAHDGACGHSHGVDPQSVSGGAGWRQAALAVFAVGVRPCSGAVLVLVFALAQGLFALGVAAVAAMALGTGLTVALIAVLALGARDLAARLAARRPAGWAVAVQLVELAAAFLLLLFGLVLFAGTWAAAL